MHDYDQCNHKINQTPEREPKHHRKTANYHPSVQPPKCPKNTLLQSKCLNNHPASAVHPHNDWVAARPVLVRILLGKEPTAGGFTKWLCSVTQVTSSAATALCWWSAKRPRAWIRINEWYQWCLIIIRWSIISNVWKPVGMVGKHLGIWRRIPASLSDASRISLIISLPRGGKMSSRGR